MARGVGVAAAEAGVGAAFGEVDGADRLAFGVEDAHAVEIAAAHAPAAPQIAVDIDAEAVRRAAFAGVDEDLALAELGPAVQHVVDDEGAVGFGARGYDIELL